MFPAAVTVSAVMVGGVRSLMFNVLVEVALLNEVIVPELVRLTVPAALLVMPVIVPVVLRLTVPVLVKLATVVELVDAPLMLTIPALASAEIDEVPPVMLSVPVDEFVNVPLP